MGIFSKCHGDTFWFDEEDYVARLPTSERELKKKHHKKVTKIASLAVAIPGSVVLTFLTSGATAPFAMIKVRQLILAYKQMKCIEEEMTEEPRVRLRDILKGEALAVVSAFLPFELNHELGHLAGDGVTHMAGGAFNKIGDHMGQELHHLSWSNAGNALHDFGKGVEATLGNQAHGISGLGHHYLLNNSTMGQHVGYHDVLQAAHRTDPYVVIYTQGAGAAERSWHQATGEKCTFLAEGMGLEWAAKKAADKV